MSEHRPIVADGLRRIAAEMERLKLSSKGRDDQMGKGSSISRGVFISVATVAFVLALIDQAMCQPLSERAATQNAPYVVVLGIAQDGGYPQAGCRKVCCRRVWNSIQKRRHVVCLAIVDPARRQRWLIECTPDFREQLHQLDQIAPSTHRIGLDGIFLTHAHIGHYAGLIHLGREVMGADRVPVYTMPRMKRFLETSGPWSQLVSAENIAIHKLANGRVVRLNKRLSVTPLLVPHRDEYSETVGFRIQGPTRSALFLPDIDKWNRWDTKIETAIRDVDVAWLDGTFFAGGELPGRDMSKIPHPFIVESMSRFADLPKSERNKVRFIHFNHTNPVLNPGSPAAKRVQHAGHHSAAEGERFEL